MRKFKIAIFASGTGSNARNMFDFFSNHPFIQVDVLITNKENIGAIEHARNFKIPYKSFQNEAFETGRQVLEELKNRNIDGIVLAGFLRKIPGLIINNYPSTILNVHPALLPKYGGKGMYGDHIHRKVIENKETETGITIHVVNEKFDEGAFVAQFYTSLSENIDLASVKSKIHALEQAYFPVVVEQYFKTKLKDAQES